MYETRRLGNCDHIGSARILRAVFRIMRDTSLVRQDPNPESFRDWKRALSKCSLEHIPSLL